MLQDSHTLFVLFRILLVIAACCSMAFPALFLFSPWYKTKLGRAFMFQTLTLAVGVDLWLLALLGQPERVESRFAEEPDRFYVYAAFLVMIICSTAWLTIMLWVYNYRERDEGQKNDRERPGNGEAKLTVVE